MVTQLLNEDRVDVVRQAAVRSLAVIVTCVDDKTKFNQVQHWAYAHGEWCSELCWSDPPPPPPPSLMAVLAATHAGIE